MAANLTQFGNDLYTGARSVKFVGSRKIWFGITAVLILLSVALPIIRGGFVFGIEFRGGSEFQVANVVELAENRDEVQMLAGETVESVVADSSPRVTVVGANGLRIQTAQLTDADTSAVQQALIATFETEEVTASFIGPSWGADITSAAIRALIVFVVLAGIVMALYFRTWKMSVAAIVSLANVMVITAGVYGAFGLEITPSAVIGFLTILGYSLYDTVVVFDKVRENTSEDGPESRRSFAESVNLAANQTLVRSINTGVVAALPVAAILVIAVALLGAGSLLDIALSLFIGIVIGTLSTIFIAAPFYSLLRENEPDIKKQADRLAVSRAEASR
jgi:preprotein translocase subunit SecF